MTALPIACLGDMHVCPMVNPGPVPHVGGPVVSPGQSFVRINKRPVAVVGGNCLCSGVPCTDPLVQGSSHVRIMGMGVVRIGDGTGHGGKLVAGAPTVRAG